MPNAVSVAFGGANLAAIERRFELVEEREVCRRKLSAFAAS